MIHDKSGTLHFSSYDRDPNKFINSIGRAALNTTVIEAAQRYPNIRVHFNHRCTGIDLERAIAHLEISSTEAAVAATPKPGEGGSAGAPQKIVRAHGDAVIGVDGAFSAVRQSMQKTIPGFTYDESYLAHGYKELTIPPRADGSWQMEKNALHIWPRKSFMMIALPNLDDRSLAPFFGNLKVRAASPPRRRMTKSAASSRKNSQMPYRSCLH